MDKARTKDISISIGETEISFGNEPANGGLILHAKPDSEFVFEFDGLATDVFVVKQHLDGLGKKITEIHMERGLGNSKETIKLVRIKYFI